MNEEDGWRWLLFYPSRPRGARFRVIASPRLLRSLGTLRLLPSGFDGDGSESEIRSSPRVTAAKINTPTTEREADLLQKLDPFDAAAAATDDDIDDCVACRTDFKASRYR